MATVGFSVPKDLVEDFEEEYGEPKKSKEHKDSRVLYYDSEILEEFDVVQQGSWYIVPTKVQGAQAAADIVSQNLREG